MRLVITDAGFIWNEDNPFLEKYKDMVLVVCLYGKAVTDKYECFVSPYKIAGMGTDRFGVEDQKFQALASVGKKLDLMLKDYRDIIFLTDNNPSSLYPYYLIKEINECSRLHLVAMSPWKFESKYRVRGYCSMLADMSKLDSVLYYDSNAILEKLDKNMTLLGVMDNIQHNLGEIMPYLLECIDKMEAKPCFFDFTSLEYVSLESEFSNIDFVKREVEMPVARLDGKKLCNVLREQRLRLAEANNIPYKSEKCHSIGPCAGTCTKCDMESEYLRNKLQQIPEEERIYPRFDPREEAAAW